MFPGSSDLNCVISNFSLQAVSYQAKTNNDKRIYLSVLTFNHKPNVLLKICELNLILKNWQMHNPH
jgi:hypothetical protein